MPAITIIVPIYNVEKYIDACFSSLLKQTFKDYVIYAVDDGTPDGCGPIIDDYAAKYPDKVVAIHKENGGYGSVLELAIHKLESEYFLICDPDDTLEENALEVLYNLAKISHADITIGAKTFVYEDSTDRDYDFAYNTSYTRILPNTVYNRNSEDFANLFYIDPSPHAKLYRKSLATNISFPKKVGYTDNLLFYISLLNSQKVIYTDQSLANYLVNRTGNTMTDVSVKAMNGQILVFKEILKQASKIKDVPSMFYYRMFESFKYMLYQTRRLNGTKEEYSQVMDSLEEFVVSLSKYRKQILPNYRRFTSVRIVERLKDEALLMPSLQKRAYRSLKKQMLDEFVKKQS